MPIRSFEYHDGLTGWNLEPMDLDRFNLLVGLSGVGKTRILEALDDAARAGLPHTRLVPSQRWRLEVEQDGAVLVLEAETTSATVGDASSDAASRAPTWAEGFERESVTRDCVELVRREGPTCRLRGVELPAISSSESAVSLFGADAEIGRLGRTLARVSSGSDYLGARMLVPEGRQPEPRSFSSVDELRDSGMKNLLLKAWNLQERFPDAFASVVERYQDVFPDIHGFRIDPALEHSRNSADFFERSRKTSADFCEFHLWIDEHGVQGPYTSDALSSGMLRTLIFFLELALAPADSTLLVDELEESLGHNCLSDVCEALWQQRPDVQVVATSHHPYILNRIPRSTWRLVSRVGNDVQVRPALDVPELATASAQDAFQLLLRYYERTGAR
jgi:predicted ATPase